MERDILSGVLPFLAVAEHRSFTRAAASLGVTPTAISKAVRQLEKRHRVVLFQRTTRSVVLTEAGSALLSRLRPAVEDMNGAFEDLGGFQTQVTGLLRLTMSRTAAQFLTDRILPEYRRQYPDVRLELSINEAKVDLASREYDAGLRQGETIEKDMIAIRVTPPARWAVYGSQDYFAVHGRPSCPEELVVHRTIGYRFLTAGTVYHWEFVRDGRAFTLNNHHEIVVDDRSILASLAAASLGLAYLTEREASQAGEKNLEPVLRDWITESPGLFLYFPIHMQTQPKLRGLVDVIAAEARRNDVRSR